MSKTFIDTNILIYSIDKAMPKKRKLAKQLIADLLRNNQAVISTQVVQEAYVCAVSKLRIDKLDAKRWCSYLERFDLIPISFTLIKEAIDCSILSAVSFWDGLVITAAEFAQCQTLLTEDLNHGQVIRGVRIINPFKSSVI